MIETTEMAVSLHLAFIFLTMLALGVNLVTVFVFKEFEKIAKNIKLVTPMLHFFLSSVIFTGIILAVFLKHYFSALIALMVLGAGIVLTLEIIRFVKQKKALKNPTLQAPFLSYVRKIYLIDTGILIALYFGAA